MEKLISNIQKYQNEFKGRRTPYFEKKHMSFIKENDDDNILIGKCEIKNRIKKNKSKQSPQEEKFQNLMSNFMRKQAEIRQQGFSQSQNWNFRNSKVSQTNLVS